MERPAWTFCFCFIAFLVVPGIGFWHAALATIATPIKDLEKNVVKGFDEVLKFQDLETDAGRIKSLSSTAVGKCAQVASTRCQTNSVSSSISSGIPSTGNGSSRRLNATNSTPTYPTTYNPNTVVNTQDENKKINVLFTKSLNRVQEVANDKYFGIQEFQTTARSLNKITSELTKIPDDAACRIVVPSYCDIYAAADELVAGVDEVNKAIDDFKNSDLISTFNDYAGYIDMLNLIPYILVVALLCFFVFWWCGALCCCHRGHRCAGFVFIPFTLFWLIAFAIFLVIFLIGTILPIALSDLKVSMLKGEPTAEDVINHIQTVYPGFWDVVFKDLEAGCILMYYASIFMIACAILLLGYSFCTCLCRPYQPKEDKAGS